MTAKHINRINLHRAIVEILPLRDNSTTNYVLTAIEGFPTMTDAAEYLDNGGK